MAVPIEKLIKLNPYDSDEVFFSKMMRLSPLALEKQFKLFEKISKLATVLKCHLILLQRPDLNVKMLYNDKHGFHLSSCDRSFEYATKENPCTCEYDMTHMDRFFTKLYDEKFIRCDLCKRYSPDWIEVNTERNDDETGGKNDKNPDVEK